jgi:GTP-binding protein Era
VTAGAPGQATQHSGTVAIVGWTNVGKSTLLNRLVGEKLAAVADVAQTTRYTLRGVCNVADRGQIVFIDTPGLHRPKHRMNRAMIDALAGAVQGADVRLLVVDAARGLGPGDAEAAAWLRGSGGPTLLALDKVDLVRPKSRLLPMIEHAVSAWGLSEIVPVSGLTGEGCDVLVDRLLALLPVGPPLYPEDYLTDRTERELAAEWVRERLLALTRQELPHATAVLVERWQERADGLVEIEATVLVERDSQKQIVIGRGGSLVRDVGTTARAEIERLLGRRVFLRLVVRTRPGWRDDERVLRELGLG